MSLGTNDYILLCMSPFFFVLTSSQEVNKRSLNKGQISAGSREQAANCYLQWERESFWKIAKTRQCLMQLTAIFLLEEVWIQAR